MSHLFAGKLFAAYDGGAIERAVLAAMALYLKHTAPSQPVRVGVETVARISGFGERRVQVAQRSLEREGWIAAVGSRKGGPRNVILYRIHLEMLDTHPDRTKNGPRADPFPEANHAPHAPLDDKQGCTGRRLRVHESANKGAPHAPEQGLELQQEVEQERAARTRATAPTQPNPALSAPQKGEEPEPLNPDLPEAWAAIVKATRPDLTADDIAHSFAKFKLNHDGEQLTPTRWRQLGTKWLIGERVAPQPQLGRNGGAWAGSDTATAAKAQEIGISARPGESFDQLRDRIGRMLETKDQKRARVADAMFSPMPDRTPRDITADCTIVTDDGPKT